MMEVTVSSDPTNPHTPGYVSLVKDGCRLADFESIVPQQPQRLEDHPGEVRLDFEAFMLNSKMAGSSQLWIHATVKACIESFDCRPELCLDLRHPSGHGRRRKRKTTIYAEGLIEMLDDGTSFSPSTPKFDQTSHTPFSTSNTSREQDEVQDTEISEANLAVNDFLKFHMNGSSAKIGDNIGVTVIMPDEFFTNAEVLYHSCGTFILVSCFLGIVLLLASGYLCFLTSRLHKTVAQVHTSTLDTVMKEHHSKYSVGDLLKSPYL
ncbi:hypothetical protein SK128_010257 [Halocaridina rubra]|uniref:ZP domain-containing protein n=1 Tax=Halocaridina rubra TaxID=373956 RepID=A0AAN8XPG3_HALRR